MKLIYQYFYYGKLTVIEILTIQSSESRLLWNKHNKTKVANVDLTYVWKSPIVVFYTDGC